MSGPNVRLLGHRKPGCELRQVGKGRRRSLPMTDGATLSHVWFTMKNGLRWKSFNHENKERLAGSFQTLEDRTNNKFRIRSIEDAFYVFDFRRFCRCDSAVSGWACITVDQMRVSNLGLAHTTRTRLQVVLRRFKWYRNRSCAYVLGYNEDRCITG